MRYIFLVGIVLLGLLAACTPSPTAAPASTPTATPQVEIVSPTGYRPLQPGDGVEGATISYHYILPSLERPTVVIALGDSLMQLVSVKPELGAGLVAYIQDIQKSPQTLWAFDEANPAQTEASVTLML